MKFLSMPPLDKDTSLIPEESLIGEDLASEFIFESVKSLIHGGECSTPGLVLIDRRACTHLALDGPGVVGQGHTGGRELSEDQRQT